MATVDQMNLLLCVSYVKRGSYITVGTLHGLQSLQNMAMDHSSMEHFCKLRNNFNMLFLTA